MRDGEPAADDVGDDVLAEIVARIGVVVIALQLGIKEVGGKRVDPHARQGAAGLSGDRRRRVWLFKKIDDAHRLVDFHDAELGGLLDRHLDAGDDAVGAFGAHVGQHVGIVHLVDVVARQDDEELRPRGLEDVEILVHRVARAAIPGRLVKPLLRRQQIEKLVHLRAQKRPAHLQVAQQAVRLVLGQDADPADVRIEAVRQREIDDAELAAEEHGGLGAPVGQLFQPAAAAAGQDQRDRAPGESLLDASRREHGFSSVQSSPEGSGQSRQ